jgi:hypothetical protein
MNKLKMPLLICLAKWKLVVYWMKAFYGDIQCFGSLPAIGIHHPKHQLLPEISNLVSLATVTVQLD